MARLASLEPGDGHFLAGDELEQGWLSLLGGGDAALDCRHDVARLLDALAVAAERPRHRRIVAGNVGCAILLGRNRHHLELDRHREVVEQYGKDGNALAYRRLEIHAREADRRIAPH